MLLWLDTETTGLSPWSGDLLLEVAAIVTDDNLNRIAMWQSVIGYTGQLVSKLAVADPFVQEMHKKSGLVNECLASNTTMLKAHIGLTNFISHWCPPDTPLAGNTVSFDREFLKVWMPKAEALLGYRNVDVSSVKELVRRWMPDVFEAWKKSVGDDKPHRALADVETSLAELRFYRTWVFDVAADNVEAA